MPTPLLTTLDSEGHIHLIIGSNPLASARCAKSIEAGAKPKIIAPADADVHYVLAKRIEDGQAEWIKENFQDNHISCLGRDKVNNVVDAVFVTSAVKNASSKSTSCTYHGPKIDATFQVPRYPTSAAVCGYQSM